MGSVRLIQNCINIVFWHFQFVNSALEVLGWSATINFIFMDFEDLYNVKYAFVLETGSSSNLQNVMEKRISPWLNAKDNAYLVNNTNLC